MKLIGKYVVLTALITGGFIVSTTQARENWVVDTDSEWQQKGTQSTGMHFENGYAKLDGKMGTYHSSLYRLKSKRKAATIELTQSVEWMNWDPAGEIGPPNLNNAPVLLCIGPNNYWMFGTYLEPKEKDGFVSKEVRLEGYDVPLKTTTEPNLFVAPGGLKSKRFGVHAWQSRDMTNWVHHGAITDRAHRNTTSAEYLDGKLYIYYDFPNDQDPHLYIDSDLTDGEPGEDHGIAFPDPSDGSDCAIIRDLDGNFHIIYEDWSPIDASKHSWDSPLGGHAVSKDGKGDFRIVSPSVDHRTTPTGVFKEYTHPHWAGHPDWDNGIAKYEVHEPEQDAFGDWAAIWIGGQYYLFGDYHPVGAKNGSHMSVALFTSDDINKPFKYFGKVGKGHPDPDIGFANGKFYLITQKDADFTSTGPWVEKVEVRVGVDVNNDGNIDQWTNWQKVSEQYSCIPGFAKQIARSPAALDLSSLPAGYNFCFELRIEDGSQNDSVPILDAVKLTFEEK